MGALASHFQHLDSVASTKHVHGDQVDSETTVPIETPCEISNCMNGFASYVLNTGTLASSSWHASSQALFPATETAVSAADNLHTPPPRIS